MSTGYDRKSQADDMSSALLNRGVVALSTAAFGSGMSMRVVDPMLVRLAADFSITIALASWTITIFGLAYGLSQLLFGPLGDRYGKVRVIAYGCGACAIAALSCALTSDFQALLVARALAGATAASIIPLSMAWIGDVVPYENRQAVLARFLIGQILGLSTGILVGGFSADYLGWRFPFFMITLWFGVICVYLNLLNRSLPAHAKQRHQGEGRGITHMLSEFRQVLAVSWAKQVLITVASEGAMVFGALAFIPAHLHTVHGLSLASAGSLVMLFGLGGLLFAARSRHLVKRFGEVGLIQRGAVLMSASLILLGVAPWWWLALPACFGFGLGFYMMHNTLQINATQMAPERRGAAVAAFASCFFLGQSLGVAASGALFHSAGTPPLLAAAGCLVLLIGLRFARLRAQKSD